MLQTSMSAPLIFSYTLSFSDKYTKFLNNQYILLYFCDTSYLRYIILITLNDATKNSHQLFPYFEYEHICLTSVVDHVCMADKKQTFVCFM